MSRWLLFGGNYFPRKKSMMLNCFVLLNIYLFILKSNIIMLIYCRMDRLRRRLTLDFPQLVFHSSSKRNICELVFVETLSADKLMHKLPQPSGTESTESTTEVSQAESDTENRHSIWRNTKGFAYSFGKGGKSCLRVYGSKTIIAISWHVLPHQSTKTEDIQWPGRSKEKNVHLFPITAAGKDVILCADKKLFSRLLIIGQSRKIDLRESSPTPWELFHIL